MKQRSVQKPWNMFSIHGICRFCSMEFVVCIIWIFYGIVCCNWILLHVIAYNCVHGMLNQNHICKKFIATRIKCIFSDFSHRIPRSFSTSRSKKNFMGWNERYMYVVSWLKRVFKDLFGNRSYSSSKFVILTKSHYKMTFTKTLKAPFFWKVTFRNYLGK